MIVCSCNVLTDHDVRSAVDPEGGMARTTGEVYGCLGCSAQCGRCAKTIRKIMTEALSATAPAMVTGGDCSSSCSKTCNGSHEAKAA